MNSGQFKKGHTPHNKGVKGQVPHNKGIKWGSKSPATEFKKGRTPHNFKGVGVPVVFKHRREVVTTTEEMIPARSRGRSYMRKKRTSYARYLWQEAYGPIPDGMIVYNNGDPEKVKLKNLELITRGELMKRNSRWR